MSSIDYLEFNKIKANKFDPSDNTSRHIYKDPKNIKKINDLSNTLIQQIDTMSQVATAFSDFASLPKAKIEKCNLVEMTKQAISLFKEFNISFEYNSDEIIHQFDMFFHRCHFFFC